MVNRTITRGKVKPITMDSWRAELDRLRVEEDPSALTTTEIAEAVGRSRVWAREYVRKELAASRVRKTYKRIARGGGAVLVAAYVRV